MMIKHNTPMKQHSQLPQGLW